MKQVDGELTVVVVGASGDLARRKVFPALFALYCQGFLPARFSIVGYARSGYAHEEFRARVMENLTCRYVPGEKCSERMDAFLARCFYQAGPYDAADGFLDLFQLLQAVEGGRHVNRMFYLAIPPSVFLDVARSLGNAGLVNCGSETPWSRVVIEKPFGHDRASSDELTREMAKVFREPQTFRIDHYLGKEVIQNLLVLRFANLIFEPIWNCRYVRGVRIAWQEELGVEGRGGYFDGYGIIRDVMQNHLLQILALVAMEPPTHADGTSIRNEKVRVLRAVPPVSDGELVVGQYARAERDGCVFPAYREDPTVPAGSVTPTYAAAALRVNTPRWEGVPFLVTAGKGLASRMTEIRVRFRDVAAGMFRQAGAAPPPNELVIRVQPQEAIQFRVVNKVPGLDMRLDTRELDLRYQAAFSDAIIPDAYESLLLDVMRGERGLFIRDDELAAAWDIFTPALHRLAERRAAPDPYPFWGEPPAAARALAERIGMA